MSDFQITCINKPDHNSAHEHITHVGRCEGSDPWKATRETVIGWIEAKTYSFYVQDSKGDTAVVYVRVSADGKRKWLQTIADGIWADNLLALPECSSTCPLKS